MTTTSKFHAGRLEIFDTVTFEHVLPVAPIVYYQDFLGEGYAAIPAAGSAADGADFVKKIVLTAGTPTVSGVANAIGGQVVCALAATSEKEDAVLYWGDNLALDCTKGLIFETRVLLSVTPSAAGAQAVWGVAGPWIDGPQNNACYLEFSAQASGAILATGFDGVTTTSLATTVTVGTTDWHIYRIDATNLTDVAFYVDGARVNADNSINFAATGTLAVDYVRAWMNRQ